MVLRQPKVMDPSTLATSLTCLRQWSWSFFAVHLWDILLHILIIHTHAHIFVCVHVCKGRQVLAFLDVKRRYKLI